MRRRIAAGNWKMHLDLVRALALARDLKEKLSGIEGVEIIICPPFPFLIPIREILKGSPIKLGAQNMHFAEEGAFTGEVSPKMLSGICEYVILGHSERRHIFGESDELIRKKVESALKFGLRPILCVGETLEERDEGRKFEVVERQMRSALEGLDFEDLIIAYEPVWAIGTGRPAGGSDAQEMACFIRGILGSRGGEVPVLYGGSVNSRNIAEFSRRPDIDGALVGGASLRAGEFAEIAREIASSQL